MRIVAFTVRVECPACEGKKRLRLKVDDPNGELVDCALCQGLGHVEAVAPFDDFAKLIRGMAALDRGLTLPLPRKRR